MHLRKIHISVIYWTLSGLHTQKVPLVLSLVDIAYHLHMVATMGDLVTTITIGIPTWFETIVILHV